MCVLIFSTTFFCCTFPVLRRIQLNTITNVSHFLIKLVFFSTDFRKILKISNFTKIRQVGAELFRVGRTDGRTQNGQSWQRRQPLFAISRKLLKQFIPPHPDIHLHNIFLVLIWRSNPRILSRYFGHTLFMSSLHFVYLAAIQHSIKRVTKKFICWQNGCYSLSVSVVYLDMLWITLVSSQQIINNILHLLFRAS
jgi:hypothetical protein